METITWDAALQDFLAGMTGEKAPMTTRFYRCQLRQLLDWAKGQDIALADFRARHMRLYLAKRAETVTDRTRNHDARCAKVFFRFCHQQGYAPLNALADYVVPKAARAHVRTPTEQDLQALLRAIETRWDVRENPNARFLNKDLRRFLRLRDYAMVVFLAATGCRVGEACALTMDNLDRHNLQLTFPVTKTRKPRTIPLTPDLLDALSSWLAWRDRLQRESDAAVKQGKDATCALTLFLTQFGTPMDPLAFSRQFRRYLVYAQITPFTRHGIRHFTAKQVARVNLRSAQQLLGHKRLSTTELYVEDDPEEVRADLAKAAPLSGILVHKRAAKPPRKKII